MSPLLNRRAFLARSAIVGCSAAASPLLTPVTFASVPSDNRLVVIILRGGMDGLEVVQPYGDPSFADLRPPLGVDEDKSMDLDGFFALSAGLGDLYPLWKKGELGFVHAVSTPYRDKRSHFDGQDLLEAGTSGLDGKPDGWLNRMLQQMPGVGAETAYAIGRDRMQLLTGPARVAEWAPDATLAINPSSLHLLEMVAHEDPIFRDAFAQAVELSGAGQSDDLGIMKAAKQTPARRVQSGPMHVSIAEFAAEKLRGESRIAAFSLNGWDTHANQRRNIGRPLKRLADTILALKTGLGPDWDRTSVVAMTEFGRTARRNGTGGTDHGTAGAVLLAGGAIRGGKVFGRWPGMTEADLYKGRDLMPTQDVRAIAGWIMHDTMGLSTSDIEHVVFPGLSLEANPGLIL